MQKKDVAPQYLASTGSPVSLTEKTQIEDLMVMTDLERGTGQRTETIGEEGGLKLERIGTQARAQQSPTAASALCRERVVFLTLVAETTQNVIVNIKAGMVITAISHIRITAKGEVIVGYITQRDGPIITVAASTQISTRTLAPGAAAGIHGDGTGGIPDLGLIPAVVPLLQKRDLTMTSLVERGNTKQGIWKNRQKTHLPTQGRKVTPPRCQQNTRKRAKRNGIKNPKRGQRLAGASVWSSSTRETRMSEANVTIRKRRNTRRKAKGTRVVNAERRAHPLSLPLTVTVILLLMTVSPRPAALTRKN